MVVRGAKALNLGRLRMVGAAFIAAPIIATVGWLATPAPAAPVPPHCVALEAVAFTTSHPVTGSWGCLSIGMQIAAVEAGFSGDAGIAGFASSQGLTGSRFLDQVGAAWLYDFHGPKIHQVVFLFADADELLYRFDGETL